MQTLKAINYAGRAASKAQGNIKPQYVLLVILFHMLFFDQTFLGSISRKNIPSAQNTDLFCLKVIINCKSQAKIANFLTFVEV